MKDSFTLDSPSHPYILWSVAVFPKLCLLKHTCVQKKEVVKVNSKMAFPSPGIYLREVTKGLFFARGEQNSAYKKPEGRRAVHRWHETLI